jgi:Mor family transcriptional regulator
MSAYLDQLHQDMVMTAVAFGMPEPEARALAATLIDRIQTKHAGDEVYIPGPNKHRRNEHIRRMFNGVNHDVVCRKFGISKATLYRVMGQHKSSKDKRTSCNKSLAMMI